MARRTDMITYICTDCAKRLGGKMPEGHLATFHMDLCSVCHQERGVTEPRDFGLNHLKWPQSEESKDFMRKELLRHVYFSSDKEKK